MAGIVHFRKKCNHVAAARSFSARAPRSQRPLPDWMTSPPPPPPTIDTGSERTRMKGRARALGGRDGEARRVAKQLPHSSAA